MKKIILQISLSCCAMLAQAQFNVADFESFTLSPNSFYKDTNSTPFVTFNARFEYEWTKGSYPFWSGGFSYTNKYDSSTAGFTNLYGVMPYKGYNNSNIYVVGQDKGLISLAASQNTVEGFYITNTTYAFKSMKNGDTFAKKFGGPTGNDPDYFKVTVKGYDNGVMKQDSVEYYLADFRFSNNTLDYIITTWQWVATDTLGEVDSLRFFMYSSDMTGGYLNTPAFFAMDNFTTKGLILGLAENSKQNDFGVYPNPFQTTLNLDFVKQGRVEIKIFDALGQAIFKEESTEDHLQLNLDVLSVGIYMIEINQNGNSVTKRLIKN